MRFAGHWDVLQSMPETKWRGALSPSAIPQDREVHAKRDLSQGHDHAQVGQAFQFLLEIRTAAADFIDSRLVVRRRAAYGCGDERIVQEQSVVPRRTEWLGSETSLVQHSVENLAGPVSGEGTAG